MCVRVLQQRGSRVQRPYMRHVLFCVALGHTVQSMAWHGVAWHASTPYFICRMKLSVLLILAVACCFDLDGWHVVWARSGRTCYLWRTCCQTQHWVMLC